MFSSVVHNKTGASHTHTHTGGMRAFKPMEIFYQEISLAVMGALLIFDISRHKKKIKKNSQMHPLWCPAIVIVLGN